MAIILSKQKCKICGKPLEIFEQRVIERKYGGEPKKFIRNLYQCGNPNCENYEKYSEPDCNHEWSEYDLGKYAFEHCHICMICGYMVCVDSSG